MESVSIKELWMLLGEKDVQIYQLLKTNEVLVMEMEAMRAAHLQELKTREGDDG